MVSLGATTTTGKMAYSPSLLKRGGGRAGESGGGEANGLALLWRTCDVDTLRLCCSQRCLYSLGVWLRSQARDWPSRRCGFLAARSCFVLTWQADLRSNGKRQGRYCAAMKVHLLPCRHWACWAVQEAGNSTRWLSV